MSGLREHATSAPPWITDRRGFLRRAGALGAGIILGPTALAACGSSASTPAGTSGSSAAGKLTADQITKATGTVNILGSQTYQTPANDPAGVTATWAYNTTNEQIITKTTQPGVFDFVIIYQGEIDQLRKLNRIQPVQTELLPNWTQMNKFFQDSELIRRDGQVFQVPYHWGYGYCEYNKDKMAEPKSLQDLMSPDLRGKVILPDDPYAVISTFAIMLGIEKPNNLDRASFDRVMTTLNDFKPQVLTIHQYGEESALFGRGDAWVGLPEYSNSVISSQAAGANMAFNRLGSFSYVDGFMILDPCTNIASSYKYINNALTADAQKASTKVSQALPVNDAAISELPPALQYTSAADVLKDAPLVPGVTVETNTSDIPFQEWVTAWTKFKSA